MTEITREELKKAMEKAVQKAVDNDEAVEGSDPDERTWVLDIPGKGRVRLEGVYLAGHTMNIWASGTRTD